MKTTIIHISDFKGTTRIKTCDGTPLIPPAPDDKTPKELCERCRRVVLETKR